MLPKFARLPKTSKPEDAGKTVDKWRLPRGALEAFKGCKISPDGTVIVYWSDTRITLFTTFSASNGEGGTMKAAGEFSLEDTNYFWKAVCLTSRYLIASTTGSVFNVSP